MYEYKDLDFSRVANSSSYLLDLSTSLLKTLAPILRQTNGCYFFYLSHKLSKKRIMNSSIALIVEYGECLYRPKIHIKEQIYNGRTAAILMQWYHELTIYIAF